MGDYLKDADLTTEYDVCKRQHDGVLQFNAIGLYQEFIVVNYTGLPIYIQGCDGKTHALPVRPTPRPMDTLNYHSRYPNRVLIRIRTNLGPRERSSEDPRREAWSGEIVEISIPTSVLRDSDVYCKEINSLLSIAPIQEGRHLQTNNSSQIREIPDTLGGKLYDEIFKDNMFSVVANCCEPGNSYNYLYAMINNMVCRIDVTSDSSVPDHVSIVYTDEDGDRGQKATWTFDEVVKSDTPLNLNGCDFYIATDPKTLKAIYEHNTTIDLSCSDTISSIKAKAIKDHDERSAIKINELEITVAKLTSENTKLKHSNDTLSERLFAEKDLIARELELKAKLRNSEASQAKSEADIESNKSKIKKEKIATAGTVLKTTAVVIPAVISIMTFFTRKK